MNEQLLEMMTPGMGGHHGGEQERERDEQKARRLVLEELRKRRSREHDLRKRGKTDATKVEMARD